MLCQNSDLTFYSQTIKLVGPALSNHYSPYEYENRNFILTSLFLLNSIFASSRIYCLSTFVSLSSFVDATQIFAVRRIFRYKERTVFRD